MNSGIVISFIIGGLLLISIITLNARVAENSGETTLNMSAKQTVKTVTQIMTRDFIRIGYNTGEKPENAIKSISAQHITFEADLNNDNTSSPREITWQAHPGDSVFATANPNDYKLTRQVESGPEQGISTFAVVDFSFSFFDKNGDTTTDSKKIRSVKISMIIEAPASYGNQGYQKSLWNKTFTPPNLNLSTYDSTK